MSDLAKMMTELENVDIHRVEKQDGTKDKYHKISKEEFFKQTQVT